MPQKIKRELGDVIMEGGQGKADDIVIPIIGPTGAGKSTFINNVLGMVKGSTGAAPVSDGHRSCTGNLTHYIININHDSDLAEDHHIGGRRIVLVDTPGFDATDLSDSEILRRIAVWLSFSYDSKMRVGGLIYMYRIWPNRITRNDYSNMKIFQKICGESCLSKVVLATTFWDLCEQHDVGEKRKKELAKLFWPRMSPESVSERQPEPEAATLWNSPESARALLKLVLKRLVDSRFDNFDLPPTIPKRARPPKPRGDDVYLKEGDGRKGDILILVMGPMGAGKSTFVNGVLGRTEALVDDSFENCTTKMTPYFLERARPEWVEGYQLRGQRIVLVDTPGLGFLEPEDMQRRVAYWLSLARDAHVNVAAVVYIVSLAPRPITRSDVENIETFQRLCQDEGLPNVTLATTRWNLCNPDQLEGFRTRIEDEFWTKFSSSDSSEPHPKNGEAYRQQADSAMDIMRVILSRYADSRIDGFITNLQQQLVEKGQKLKHTDAAQELRRKLELLLKESGSSASQDRKEKLKAITEEVAQLRPSLGTRIKKMWNST